jgi:hypothetical protein
MPRKIKAGLRGQRARLARHRRVAVVIALLALGVLVEATGVLAGASGRTASPAVAGKAPVAIAGPGGRVYVGHSYKNDVSPALTQIPPVPLRANPESEASPNPHIGRHVDAKDTVVQRTAAAPNMPSPTLNFDGIPFPGVACNCARSARRSTCR